MTKHGSYYSLNHHKCFKFILVYQNVIHQMAISLLDHSHFIYILYYFLFHLLNPFYRPITKINNINNQKAFQYFSMFVSSRYYPIVYETPAAPLYLPILTNLLRSPNLKSVYL